MWVCRLLLVLQLPGDFVPMTSHPPKLMKQSTAATLSTNTRIATVALMAVGLLTSCATPESPKAPALAARGVADRALVGGWTIAIEPTADGLARAQFGTKQTVTVKAGASAPVTNLVTTPFDQKKYDESKTFWIENLNKPGLQWHFILKSDHTGLEITHDEQSNQPLTNAIKWDCHGPQLLHLEFPEKKHFNDLHCRIVSSNEWHYPMKPLGGWFVMRRK